MKTLHSSHQRRLPRPLGLLTRIAPSLLGLSLLLAASTAFAESATITMTSGEVTHAEIVALEFGKQVSVRLSDGTEKTIPWSEIEDLKMDQRDPSAEGGEVATDDLPVRQESEPEEAESSAVVNPQEVPPTVAPAPAPSATKADSTAIYQELALVDRDISDAKAEMPVIGGPITLTLIGLGVGGLVIASTVNAESNCGSYCNLGPSYGIGAFNLGVGVIGAIWWGAQVAARGEKKEEIRALEAKRDRLRLDLETSGSGAVGSVTLTF